MTYYADAIWKGKMSRLRDPKVEKMEPLVGLMGMLGRASSTCAIYSLEDVLRGAGRSV
jgi:hypothetical protein